MLRREPVLRENVPVSRTFLMPGKEGNRTPDTRIMMSSKTKVAERRARAKLPD